MKKTVFILLMALAPLSALLSQNDDAVAGSSTDLQFESEVPVMQNSGVNYVPRWPMTYQDECCRLFIEGNVIYSRNNAGLGFNITYLPKHWGGYGSLNFLEHSTIASCGVALRPRLHAHFLDWQVYVGAAFCDVPGFEFGMRLSATSRANRGALSWWSGSIGRIYVNRNIYHTVGLSIDLATMLMWVLW